MSKSFAFRLILSLNLLWCLVHSVPMQAATCPEPLSGQYLVGAAQDDITGPLVGVGMLGYANLQQESTGLHMRLRSRALVLRANCQEPPIALVIADLGLIFAGLRSQVLAVLERERPGVFHSKRVMISASHTHSGTGGYADHALYNFTTLGFEAENFATIAHGIAQSIIKAHDRLRPRRLSLHSGLLKGIQFNRSPEAYLRNPEVERNLYAENVDSEMTVLDVKDNSGTSRASFNWYPLHGVSLSMENRLISGDNKGLAAYLVERNHGTRYQADDDYIAGFLQSHSGDVSPYPLTGNQAGDADDHGFVRNEQAARAQSSKAEELILSPGLFIRGPIRTIERWVDLRNFVIRKEFADGQSAQTCEGVLGVGFAAGTENGQPLKLFKEGTVFGLDWPRVTLFPKEQKCQAEKVMLIPSGMMLPAWTANVAPFQIFQVGSLGIIAAPFEMTTMAGRRLKKAMELALASEGIETVVISALANEYLHYVTTREEYSQQDYEGGSTLFGPWSLAAYSQIFSDLAKELSSSASASAPASAHGTSDPPSLSRPRFETLRLPRWDTHPTDQTFGSLRSEPKERYGRGEGVEVVFWAAKPSRTRKASYFTVQMQVNPSAPGNSDWKTVYYDWDPQTRLAWQRVGLTESTLTVRWTPDTGDGPGRYRICLEGERYSPFEATRSYRGCSRAFGLD